MTKATGNTKKRTRTSGTGQGDDSTQDDSTQDDSTQDDNTQDDSTQDDSTQGDNTQDDNTQGDNQDNDQDAGTQGDNDLQKQIKALRREAASWRKKYRTAETSADDIEGKLADLQAQVATMQEQANGAMLEKALIAAAARAGMIDPADAVAHAAFDKLSLADDGTVTGVTEELKRLRKEKPYLFGKTRPGATFPGGEDASKEERYRKELFGSSGAAWQGGGVIMNTKGD